MKKIVYLPLDERPCNYSFVGFLSENNKNYRLVRPSMEEMGDKKIPAEYEKIENFLYRECKDADYLIIAIDTLLYGGIIPSRLHHLDRETLAKRLEVLSLIKERNPKMTIYAFSLVMRCPCYSDADEEPDYYGVCGLEIFEYGQNEHKFKDGKITREEYLAEKERLKACEPYLEDYLTRRACNVSLLIDALNLVGTVVKQFVILQDDSNPCGFTAMDQAKVRKFAQEKNLDVAIYPGADEGGLSLLARAVADMEGYAPKIYPVYPKEECKNVIPMYEDRAVYKSILAQIQSAGGVQCDSEEEADILLFCNLPVGKVQNVSEPHGRQYYDRDLPAFIKRMKKAVESGKGVAVADIAYCNGADTRLTESITQEIGFFKLWGYAGWNTSSNTLGTVICQAVLRYFYGDTPTHRKFTAERMYEDVGYCAYVRKRIWDYEVEQMGYKYEDTKVQQGEVSERVQELLEYYMSANYPELTEKYEIEKCYMPWRRMFEVGLIIKEK
ncbi:MAG: DUF4127 family protein [Clostridia bacterium]|nr:DUF4127 family protein [Clostridia bacterium]